MMNVFYVDSNPAVAAKMMCDKHVVKMILESAQILSTAHRVLDGDERADNNGLYKATHKSHPSAVWARNNSSNYEWLWEHMAALMKEYTARYGKIHATERLTHSLWELPRNISHNDFSPPPQCMPDKYKCNPNSSSKADCVSAYRGYYLGDKMHMAKWQYTEVPSWATA